MVKLEGNRQVTTLISPAYIRGAKAVQHALRQEIAARGISIETNPSSNVLISNFRRYDKHPILSFYNRGLPVTQEEENACPQLSVSINTDDKGVFYTDLENEFALLARSLEECMDAHEQPRFRKNDIYVFLLFKAIIRTFQIIRPIYGSTLWHPDRTNRLLTNVRACAYCSFFLHRYSFPVPGQMERVSGH